MSILDELLASVRVDQPVRQVQIGPFFTAVVAERCGLASTPQLGEFSFGRPPVSEAGRLAEQSALQLARLSQRESPLERSVGVAALNALLEVEESRCVDLNARDLLLERGRGKRVTLVGHFPFAAALRQAVGRLSVLELHPQPGDLPASEAERVIPESQVVAITGATLVNGTLDRLLSFCPSESFVMILGPSTPLSTVLFDHGVDVLSGTVVADVSLALRYLAEGATFHQVNGTRRVSLFR